MFSLYKIQFIACAYLAFWHSFVEPDLICYKRPPEVPIHKCCSLPHFYSQTIKEKCNSNKDHFEIEMEYQHYCFISCAVEEIGFLRNEANLDIYLKEIFKTAPDVLYLVKDAFRFCWDKNESMGKILTTTGPCAFYYVLIMDCVIVRIFENCPNFLWLNTSECNEARNYWHNCLVN